MTTIAKARTKARISQNRLARVLNRSFMTISLWERGLVPIDEETERVVIAAIAGLAEIRREAIAREKQLTEQLSLPPAKSGRFAGHV